MCLNSNTVARKSFGIVLLLHVNKKFFLATVFEFVFVITELVLRMKLIFVIATCLVVNVFS